ncbi:hypothetical protein CONLIGDRAFT_630815 [Coniochaeta ligniaria NRRL 30616]|uniref:VLRF1 domain-containing protein n=1 Tax=Coniochaeta ligniaria NRRL 30616 TaxID=1408157 RepID=A0A1J7ITT6_9PEZI|nr:hypothetical protein CONLIGDRAFT_630815 [Coniochaeta ligniaria NRRL 30616]
MEKKPHEDLLRRPLYLYDLPAEVLDTITLKSDADVQDGANFEETTETPLNSRSSSPGPENVVGSQACSLCSLSFVTVQDQRGHLKSDLHHYNLKQKLRGLNPVSEAEFEKLIGRNLDESLSGSDSSESEEDDERKETTLSALLKKQATLAHRKENNGGEDNEAPTKKRGSGNAPMMWFTSSTLPKNSYFGIYKAMFTPEELGKQDIIVETIKKKQLAPIAMPKPNKDGTPAPAAYKGPHIFLCMIGGGHFAAMVVSLAPRQSKHGSSSGPLNREATVLAHKTFHRYTTRRKQGGSQSANDNAKGAAHSAGAGIRRYNEQALVEDVRALLQEWKALLDTSDLLFIRATGSTNRRTLFGPYENQVLRANDPRIRGFPFSTRRATQNELMRSFIELTRLKVREINPVTATEPSKTSGGSTTKQEKPAAPALSEEEQTALLHTTQIQALIRRAKLPALLSYLSTNSLPPDFRFYPAHANHHAPTPLHLAAAQGSAALVMGLIARGGADPTARSEEGKTPFELASDRSTRDAFRVARGVAGEEKWDWDAAGVPTALSKEEVDKREERERKEREAQERERRAVEEEKLRAQRVPIREDGKGKKGVLGGLELKKTAQERREDEARGLTAEQRARLDRERRARAAEERIRRMQGGG